jgi:hypothetical protein
MFIPPRLCPKSRYRFGSAPGSASVNPLKKGHPPNGASPFPFKMIQLTGLTPMVPTYI